MVVSRIIILSFPAPISIPISPNKMRINSPRLKSLARLTPFFVLATIVGFASSQSSSTTTTTTGIARATTTTTITVTATPTTTPVATPPATCQPTFDCSTSPKVNTWQRKKSLISQYFFCALRGIVAHGQKVQSMSSDWLIDIPLLIVLFLGDACTFVDDLGLFKQWCL